MSIQNILNYIKENKDALAIIITTFFGLITLGTFIKALIEFRLQGRQKRAELYNKFDKVFDEESIKRIVDLVETNIDNNNESAIKALPLIDRYYFLGFFEQISLAVNSKLLSKKVVYYMFGKFALNCWNTESYWDGIDKYSHEWYIFRCFVLEMEKEEKRMQNTINYKTPKLLFGRVLYRH